MKWKKEESDLPGSVQEKAGDKVKERKGLRACVATIYVLLEKQYNEVKQILIMTTMKSKTEED